MYQLYVSNSESEIDHSDEGESEGETNGPVAQNIEKKWTNQRTSWDLSICTGPSISEYTVSNEDEWAVMYKDNSALANNMKESIV
jgi:hypothetical protein